MQERMDIAVICAGLLGLLLISLSGAISLVRLKTGVLTGSNNDPAGLLTKLVRAQANTAEYAPLFAVFILYLGTRQTPSWVGLFMIIAVMSRYLFVIGMLASYSIAQPNPIRFVGALGTYIAGAVLSIALLMQF